MTIQPKCTSVFGHNFEARYDEHPPQDVGEMEGSALGIIRFIEARTKRIYVRDVCTRCGQTIEKATAP